MKSPELRVSWKNVLHEIYTNSPGWYESGDPTKIRTITAHPLARKLGIVRSELNHHIRFLQKHGLIKSGTVWEMTMEGFVFAVRNEKIRYDDDTRRKTIEKDASNRRSMLLVTIVIAIAALLELVPCVFN